jgi:DNA-binding MarR family transcriptional regulator/N-acetylglutamate synthase-like GNAT family acetyltransferase
LINNINMSDIAAVRRFNRLYTRHIGILRQDYLDSHLSLGEVRVLYEIAHRDRPTATAISKDLDLDPGYLSRLLSGFEKRGLISRTKESDDARRSRLHLTRQGHKAFTPIERAADRQIGALLAALAPPTRRSLIQAMQSIEAILDPSPSPAPYLIRNHEPGDMGWIIHRHGALYAQEYGWDESFEAEVAEIAAHFIKHYDPKRERCWIAEKDGAITGCIFLVRKTDRIGKLRLFLVEPSARGLGIGNRLVTECVRFARQAGYRKITLWTQSILLAARHLYTKHGFRLIHKERHHSFGHSLIAETWELKL